MGNASTLRVNELKYSHIFQCEIPRKEIGQLFFFGHL